MLVKPLLKIFINMYILKKINYLQLTILIKVIEDLILVNKLNVKKTNKKI